MKNKRLLIVLACLWTLYACKQKTHSEGEHQHNAQGNNITPSVPELEALAFTLYSDKTELFVEFKPLVVGKESRFAAHFTALGASFKAIGEGNITLTLTGAAGTQSISATKPEIPGIFRLRMTPEKAGTFTLVFDIKTPAFSDKITLENVKIYPDEKSAIADQPVETGGGKDITYLKEQAWKVDFANTPARIQPFAEVIRTTGQILAAPNDEAVLTAQISGIVSYTGKNLVLGNAIGTGTTLFTVKSNDVVKSNLSANVQQAENNVATAQTQFNRVAELMKDKLITEKEFLEAKLRLDNAQTELANVTLSKTYNQNKQSVAAPISGFLKTLLVENGQFVQAGQTLATISKNQKLLLKIDIPQKDFAKIGVIKTANFKINDQLYTTNQLNGRVVSYGKNTPTGSPFIPFYFEIDNKGNFISGSVIEVFLQTGTKSALTIPLSSLVEEQGIFYTYVQTEGESFQKRELKIGSSDGLNVEVLSGISVGERVVTKGSYQIKLATASGTIPAHGHEH